MDGKAIADAIAEFVILDMQNPEIVEGRGNPFTPFPTFHFPNIEY